MDTKTRPAPLPVTDLESELRFYRSRWIRLSAAIRKARGTSWAPPATGQGTGRHGQAAVTGGATLAMPGINEWSAGP